MPEDLKHRTKKGIYWTSFNQFANLGISFVIGICLARILSPSDYGTIAIPAVLFTIADALIDSGFASAMVRKVELKECDISTAFFFSLCIGILLYLIVFFAAPFISDFYQVPILTPLIRITALSFLWTPLMTPQTILLRRKLDFKTPARIAIVTKIIGGVAAISVAYCGYGIWALVTMNVVSSLLSFIQTWLAVKWFPKERWSKDSFKYLWGYGNKLLLSSLIARVYDSLTPLIVGKYYSTADLGVYNRARNYADLPSQQSTNVLQQVTFPVLSKLQNDDDALRRNYRKILKDSAFVVFPVMTLLAALAEPVIILMITEKWLGCVLLLQLLCFTAMWYPIHAINLNLLQVKGRSDMFLKLEIWKRCIGLTIMACTLPFGLVYFVAAGIASSFISLFINTYYTGKLIDVGFLKQMRDLLPTYGLALLMFCVVFGMNHFIDNLWVQLILGGFVGVGLYVGLAYLFHFSEIQDVIYMLKIKK